MKRRLREIFERLAQLRTQLRSEGEVDMDAIENEIGTLEAEREQSMRRMEIIERLENAAGEGVVRVDGSRENAQQANRSAEFSEPAEYRDAWAARMLGMDMTEAQRSTFDTVNAEYRAFTHTTENTAVLIPETVVAGIWKRAEEAYPLWNDVRKFNVRGTLTMKRFDGIKAGDAAWYEEPDVVEDEENAFSEISLTGCELAKSVTVSWKLRAMAISEFIPFIEREIGERMGVALGTAAFKGKGKPGNEDSFKPEPRGIKTYLEGEEGTPQIVEYTAGALTDTDLRAAISKLHSSNIPGTAIYVNNNTAWTILAEIKDANKRPIFIPDQGAQGAVGRIFGMQIKIDASIGDGEILFGNANRGYWANINRGMTMHTEEHVKARTTDYMGYAIVDGDVYDPMAFALLKPAST